MEHYNCTNESSSPLPFFLIPLFHFISHFLSFPFHPRVIYLERERCDFVKLTLHSLMTPDGSITIISRLLTSTRDMM